MRRLVVREQVGHARSHQEVAQYAFVLGSTQERASPPRPLVDTILIRDRLVKVLVLVPGPGDIAEVALADRALAQAGAPDQGFDRDRIEALALGLCPPAELQVDIRWNLSEGVLHA